MSEDKARIAFLEGKVKNLERQLSQRVRNFLVRGSNRKSTSPKIINSPQELDQKDQNHQNKVTPQKSFHQIKETIVKNQDSQTEPYKLESIEIKEQSVNSKQQSPVFESQSIQTETFQRELLETTPQREPQESRLSIPTDISPYDQSFSEVSHKDISSFGSSRFPDNLNKHGLTDILTNLVDKKSNQEQEKEQIDQSGDFEVRKWKKRVKKLKKQLQFKDEMLCYTKEGLLLSEQENYRFRTELKQMKNYHFKRPQLSVISKVFSFQNESVKNDSVFEDLQNQKGNDREKEQIETSNSELLPSRKEELKTKYIKNVHNEKDDIEKYIITSLIEKIHGQISHESKKQLTKLMKEDSQMTPFARILEDHSS